MQVGYHNEHHDFPSVPWTRLPELRQMAKEYYDPLPNHPSWPGVTFRFIFGQSCFVAPASPSGKLCLMNSWSITEKDVGMWSRAKRLGRGGARGGDGGGAADGVAGGLKDD